MAKLSFLLCVCAVFTRLKICFRLGEESDVHGAEQEDKLSVAVNVQYRLQFAGK